MINWKCLDLLILVSRTTTVCLKEAGSTCCVAVTVCEPPAQQHTAKAQWLLALELTVYQLCCVRACWTTSVLVTLHPSTASARCWACACEGQTHPTAVHAERLTEQHSHVASGSRGLAAEGCRALPAHQGLLPSSPSQPFRGLKSSFASFRMADLWSSTM